MMNSADSPQLLVLVGTKAQFIKTAPVLRELDARGMAYRLIYTGQHSETFKDLEQALETRPPDDCLVPGTEADSSRGLLAWAIRFTRAAFGRIRRGEWRGFRWGIVHGDTASTLLSALVLRAAGVPVAHVEAGLRSPNLLSPFPEELIRRLVSRLTALHLAPDQIAVSNLHGRGGHIVDTGGNTLRDVLRFALQQRNREHATQGGGGGYAIVSMHRHENLSNRRRLDRLLSDIVAASRQVRMKFVLHPVTRKRLMTSGWWSRLAAEPGIELLPRMDYPAFVKLMLDASFLMTDGGSNQEEAAMLGLPTLLLRDATERPDGLGNNVLLSNLDSTVIDRFVRDHSDERWPIQPLDPGSPSKAVIDALERFDP